MKRKCKLCGHEWECEEFIEGCSKHCVRVCYTCLKESDFISPEIALETYCFRNDKEYVVVSEL